MNTGSLISTLAQNVERSLVYLPNITNQALRIPQKLLRPTHPRLSGQHPRDLPRFRAAKRARDHFPAGEHWWQETLAFQRMQTSMMRQGGAPLEGFVATREMAEVGALAGVRAEVGVELELAGELLGASGVGASPEGLHGVGYGGGGGVESGRAIKRHQVEGGVLGVKESLEK
eukprot:CAMPEP_0174896028 /NCGR_PEP_ID=MMETSP0167-20121228/10290_1 /TAXON_ID=38298 /ORGANISM="Rhodella maculata, Strain CCMP736" /LENGTH=172 /DNA_ID=CAMNT_0016135477 /DNA_START=174 /DNA_END=693 /DNA_ORIENTATION=-